VGNKVKVLSQSVQVKNASFEDAMRYRELALKTNNREAAMLAILNFRVWIRASVINLIEEKKLELTKDPKQLE